MEVGVFCRDTGSYAKLDERAFLGMGLHQYSYEKAKDKSQFGSSGPGRMVNVVLLFGKERDAIW